MMNESAIQEKRPLRLLMLGGSAQQVVAIEHARALGHYVITCDYLPSNPGHKLADECFNVSTTDLEAVLDVARRCKVDGVIAYASDPAALTAAYVAQELGLPGNPFESVRVLSEKDLFREYLRTNGFNCPRSKGFTSFDDAQAGSLDFEVPFMVKPVDSSGSKGVVKVIAREDADAAIGEAFRYSRNGRIIIEEFIKKKGYQVSGDAFSVDGELVFSSYGNELYNSDGVRDYVALGEFWPSKLTAQQKKKVDSEIQRLISSLGMGTTAYNVEVILDEDDDVFIVELAPRNGGSYIPQLIEYATGVDLVDYSIKAALGEDCSGISMVDADKCVGNYMIYSTEPGRFAGFAIDPAFEENNLLEIHCTCSIGDEVEAYKNTTHSLGTVLYKADDPEEIERIATHLRDHFQVVVDR